MAMDNDMRKHITSLFTSSQAWEYMLLPREMTDGRLYCYGESDRDYSAICEEVNVLFGYEVVVEQVESKEFRKLLRHSYRHQADVKSADVQMIDNGQSFLIGIIEEAFDILASDIHIETYDERCRIRFRIDGKLIERYAVPRINYPTLVNQIKILSNLDISERRLPQDGRILFDSNGKKFDLRVSSLPTINGEKIVLRLLTRHVELLDLANLGFSEKQLSDYVTAIEKQHGLILICGPTGSGKSTTLYATLRRLNNDHINILTIEDPVEYTLDGVNQVQLKEEIGLNFGAALRTFLRQDPDIIMLGEIRDPDTAHMAIRSSLTGHLIFSTIHTNSAWGCVSRLKDMGIHSYLIADSLVMCIAQRLVRLLCEDCKTKDENNKYYMAVGCAKCYYTGYRSRKAIYEVVRLDEELAKAINTEQVEINLQEKGVTSLAGACEMMLDRGETSWQEYLSVLNDR